MTTFSDIDAGWWDFSLDPTAGLTYQPYTGGDEDATLDPYQRSWSAVALIEVPAIPTDAYGYGIFGKKRHTIDASNDDKWGLYYGVGATSSLLGHTEIRSSSKVELNDPILPNIKTLVAMRYIYKGGGSINTLSVSVVDHRGINTSTILNAAAGNLSNNYVWVAGRPGKENLHGKIYWCGFFESTYLLVDGATLTDQNLLDLYAKKYHPTNINTLTMYMDFHETVGTFYTPEILNPNSPITTNDYSNTWRPYEFDVVGGPVKGGETNQTAYCSVYSSWWETDYDGGTRQRLEMLNTNPDYLDFYTQTHNFTVAALVKREVLTGPDQYGTPLNVFNSWDLTFNPGTAPDAGELRFYAVDSGGASSTKTKYFTTAENFTNKYGVTLVSARYTYNGGANNNTVTLSVYNRKIGAALSSTTWNDVVIPKLPADVADRKVWLAAYYGRLFNPGFAYWVAFWDHGAGAVLSDSELLNSWKLHNEVYRTKPTELKMFIDFHQPVAATYTTEIGDYEFSTIGAPIFHGNTGQVVPDLPRLLTATYIDNHTVRLVFDQPMSVVDPELYDPGSYSFVGPAALTVASAALVSYRSVDLTTNEEILPDSTYTVTVIDVYSSAGTAYVIDPAFDQASFTSPLPVDTGVFIAEILIGETVVWSANANTAKSSITLNTENFHGMQKLKFRIRRTS